MPRDFASRILRHWLALLAVLGLSAWLAGCASLPPPQRWPVSSAPEDVAGTELARVAESGRPHGPGWEKLSGFRLLPEGATAFNARAALARRAQKTIDAQYYILQDDATGLMFLRELREAARRGVRVRLLVDGLYVAGKDDLFASLAAEPNFELRQFNPLAVQQGPLAARMLFSLGDFRRINRRMHNKLFLADNSLAVTGGRNIADEYFMHSGSANFIDMDVLAAGAVVPELSASFDDYWNSRQVRPIQALRALPDPAWARQYLDARFAGVPLRLEERETDVIGHPPVEVELGAGRLSQVWAEARVLADIPEKITIKDAEASFADSVTQRTIAILTGAREEVVMVSPYFIPGSDGIALIKQGIEHGVRMVVLTNSLDATDETLVYSGYARYRLSMLKAGVKLYELGSRLTARGRRFGDFRSSGGRLHAKIAIVDNRQLFVGSMNLDGRSARLNTEVGLVIDSPALIAQFGVLVQVRELGAYELRLSADGEGVRWVEHDEDGQEVETADEPGANPFGRLRDWLLLRLVPEDML